MLLTAGVAGAGVIQASPVSAGPHYTVSFNNKPQCEAAKGQYSTSFTRIVQGCTYSGPMFGGWKMADGPYFLVYTSRTS